MPVVSRPERWKMAKGICTVSQAKWRDREAGNQRMSTKQDPRSLKEAGSECREANHSPTPTATGWGTECELGYHFSIYKHCYNAQY